MTTLEQRSDRMWAALLVSSVGAITAVEVVALRTDTIQTLCRSLCRWFGISPRHSRRRLAVAAVWCLWWGLFWVHLETLPPFTSRSS